MDPEATLRELRDLANELDDNEDLAEDEVRESAARMAELFQALDGWLSHGGFSPWKP